MFEMSTLTRHLRQGLLRSAYSALPWGEFAAGPARSWCAAAAVGQLGAGQRRGPAWVLALQSSMSRLMRSLLICLLVLVLPAQGAAVAAMVACGPRHQPAAMGDGITLRASNGPAHSHAAGPAGHDHHHAAEPAATDDAHKCSACASCCSAGAILNTVPAEPLPELVAAVFARWVASVDPFAVDGPDRPPRPSLA